MGREHGEAALFAFNLIGGFFLFLLTVPTFIVSVTSFGIAGTNKDAACDTSSVVKLSTWLFVNAAVSLGYCVGGLFLCYLHFKTTRARFFGYLLLSTLLTCLFKLPWNIIGAVSLFRDSGSCYAASYSLWAMVLAVLILQWIIMAIIPVMSFLKCLIRD